MCLLKIVAKIYRQLVMQTVARYKHREIQGIDKFVYWESVDQLNKNENKLR